MPISSSKFDTAEPPFETQELRQKLVEFLDRLIEDPIAGLKRPIGNFKWGVYAFYDYDGEPIYIGQTNECLRTRIRRHLTNQRTDAVAMSVLDPFEVCEIEVWPLPQFEQTDGKDPEARAWLNALEHKVYDEAVRISTFSAVLNEKDPISCELQVSLPISFRGSIVSDEVLNLRGHPDLRIARRALVIARLSQVIAERKVQGGLRRVLLIQANRLAWLSEQRFQSLGGAASVPTLDSPDDSDV